MAKVKRIEAERIYYSESFPGTKANYNWPIECAVTNGYLSITQTKDDGPSRKAVVEIVLLSPEQWRKIVAFVQEHSDG